VWLGLLVLLALLAPLCTTAALVLARNHWLAVALRYVVGVLLMRSSASLRFRCLERWRFLQAAVAWVGLALLAAVGILVAVYLATCYSVTALLSVPILDLTLTLASVPALRRHVLRPDLVFLESYRQVGAGGRARGQRTQALLEGCASRSSLTTSPTQHCCSANTNPPTTPRHATRVWHSCSRPPW